MVAKSKYEQAIRKATPTTSQADEESVGGESDISGGGDRDLSDPCDGGSGDSSEGEDVSGAESDEGAESVNAESDEEGRRGQFSSDVTEGRTLFIR